MCFRAHRTRVQGLHHSSYCLSPAENVANVPGTVAMRTTKLGEGGIQKVYLDPPQCEGGRHSLEGAIDHCLPVMPRLKSSEIEEGA